MENILFYIKNISSGWFDICFSNNERKICIGASDAWGNDSPKHFLHILSMMIGDRYNSGYVVFDEEPGTYIVFLQKSEKISLEIFYSDLDDDEWRGFPLHGFLSKAELEQSIPIETTLFAADDIDLNNFAFNVLKSFRTYLAKHKRDQYEGNWMVFPMEEYELLRHRLENV